MQKRIYVASSWRNAIQPCIVDCCRSFGHIVYDFKNPPKGTGFGWSAMDANWKDWSLLQWIDNINDPIAQAGFDSDFNAMCNADVCILVMPGGRSAHTEAGWMKGQGKQVWVYFEPEHVVEPELMYKIFDGIIVGLRELKLILEHYAFKQ